MPRRFTTASTLENLKKEAKRWLKSLRAGDAEARARLDRTAVPLAAEPGLREIQQALAIEYGFSGWTSLKEALAERALAQGDLPEIINLFLATACADPVLARGPADHARRSQAALRILNRYPEIAGANIHTAVVCGNLKEVNRILERSPQAAAEPGGPLRRRHLTERQKLWTPLLHLCYGRLSLQAAADHAPAIALTLLEHGADPNDFFEVGSHPCRYTALCGVAGEGEDSAPYHPRRDELARLLLQRGAEPYDIQLLYNTHFQGDILWYLRLMHEFSIKAGRQADWADPSWSMINMGGGGHGARYLLGVAVANNQLPVAKWCLEQGASPNAAPSSHPNASKESLYHEAQRRGFAEMADLLAAHGADIRADQGETYERNAIEEFAELCLKAGSDEISSRVRQLPEYLRSYKPMWLAAAKDRADVVELLLDLGMSIEIEDETKQRAMHVAAGNDSFRVTKLLIDRGAELDCVETNWNSSPLGQAIYGNRTAMIELLGGYSSDPFNLATIGHVARLREVLAAQPSLARSAVQSWTPLMCLPDDPARAVEVVKLLLEHGADPTLQNQEGKIAADIAQERGLYEAAQYLSAAKRPPA